ncbi:hypothetical protein MASR1M8_18550 [Thermomonas brevis]
MPRPILAACLALLAIASTIAPAAHARSAQLRVAKVGTAVATLEGVRVRLDWPADAAAGDLQVWAREAVAHDLGYRYRDLHWRCPLQRDGRDGWRCEGAVRSGRAAPMRLAVRLDAATTHAQLARGASRMTVDRTAASPDITRVELAAVPVAWAKALVAQAWPAANLTAGTLDASLAIATPAGRPLRVSGPMRLRGLALETADAAIAGENLGADLRIDYRSSAGTTLVAVDGALRGGEFLMGNTYVSLPATPTALRVDGIKRGDGGWELPTVEWGDGEVLQARASLAFDAAGALQSLQANARSTDMTPLKPRYLSGWMGLFGLGEVELHGAMDLQLSAGPGGELRALDARLHGVDLRDPSGRFVFDGLDGDLRYSAGAAVDSALRWQGGKLYGLAFGPARLPFASANGELRAAGDIAVPLLGGRLAIRDLAIRPPQGEAGADIRFALGLRDLDFGTLAQAVGLPAFQGRLSGDIPAARYANQRVDFDGGLSMQLFGGQVRFSALSMERPFGTAPSLSADIAVDDLDLLPLTEVLGFGSISGRLDGRIDGLRLVDWTPVAFNARFITDAAPGVRQRISQRAVQNISSVGDSSFVSSLQGRLIGLFDDFGYRRIGIGCRLVNEVCLMSGLHSAGNAFTIVEGAGLPRLTVVGYNRRVDWPTLVDRLMAVGKGDVAPVID